MFNHIPIEFLRSVGPSFGYYPSESSDSSSMGDYDSSEDIEEDLRAGEWPTYTSEELFKHLKEMKYRVKQQVSYRSIPCKEIRDELMKMYKMLSGKDWTFGSSEEDDFKIEPSDDEVIVNYKIFMMAAEALPNALLIDSNNRNTIRGFFKYAYCLDPTLGTNMLFVINKVSGMSDQKTDTAIYFYYTQSMKIPDWKISLFLACIKIASECTGNADESLHVRNFCSKIISYYDTTNWEGLYIDMSDWDCMLLDNIFKIEISRNMNWHFSTLGKTPYLHLDNPKIPSIIELFKTSYNQGNTLHSIHPEVLYEIQVLERESIKIINRDERHKRVKKLITIFEIVDQKNNHNTVADSISLFLIKCLKHSEEDITIDCLKALSSSEVVHKPYIRCKGVIQAILPLLDKDSLLVREEAYKCGAKHLIANYGWEPLIMHRIFSAFSVNPKPGKNYLQIFSVAFKHFCTQSEFTEKALEVIQTVTQCLKEQDYFLEIADTLAMLLSIHNLPSVFRDCFVPPLDILLMGAIDSKSVDTAVAVQKLIEVMLNAVVHKVIHLQNFENLAEKKDDYQNQLHEIVAKFHIPEMLRFLIENDKELSSLMVSVILDSTYYKSIRIHPDQSNEEFIARSLARSKDRELHCALSSLLNKHFVGTGVVLLPQSEIDRLVNEKISCPEIHETENQKFIYSIAHFGDFKMIADIMGEHGCTNAFLYENDADPSSEVILTNYLRILDYNITVRPKQLEMNEIYDALTDCITSSIYRSMYCSSLLKRITLLLEVYISEENEMSDSDDLDSDTEYDSDDFDIMDFDPYLPAFEEDSDYYDEDEEDSDDME